MKFRDVSLRPGNEEQTFLVRVEWVIPRQRPPGLPAVPYETLLGGVPTQALLWCWTSFFISKVLFSWSSGTWLGSLSALKSSTVPGLSQSSLGEERLKEKSGTEREMRKRRNNWEMEREAME